MSHSYSGNILSLESEGKLAEDHVCQASYQLKLSSSIVNISDLVGSQITIDFEGLKACVRCGRSVKKTFPSGYCFPCFRSRPETDLCIVKPELCHYDNNTCRDSEWGRKHCMQEHSLYLSYTSDIKVGLTRSYRLLSRWIDQGASQAVELARVPTRLEAGLAEVHLKSHYKDKTQPKKMLSADAQASAEEIGSELRSQVAINHLADYKGRYQLCAETPIIRIIYPEATDVKKLEASQIQLINFDKQPSITGVLTTIKGQYLIFDGGRCVSMRKHLGYQVKVAVADT